MNIVTDTSFAAIHATRAAALQSEAERYRLTAMARSTTRRRLTRVPRVLSRLRAAGRRQSPAKRRARVPTATRTPSGPVVPPPRQQTPRPRAI